MLRLIVWPQEVSEVTEVKVKKILDENPKIAMMGWLILGKILLLL